jgi:hypothetical protein
MVLADLMACALATEIERQAAVNKSLLIPLLFMAQAIEIQKCFVVRRSYEMKKGCPFWRQPCINNG